MKPLPDALPISPRSGLDATVAVPGSKSLTNRALLIAALAEGESTLGGALRSDDTDVMRAALAQLGARVESEALAPGQPWRVHGTGGRLATPGAPLYTQNSGTSARFLTAAATLAPGESVIDGNARMRERPIVHLTEGLASLGAGVRIEGENGCPPVRVLGGGLPGGPGEIDCAHSSQYTSAVLLAAPYAQRDVVLRFKEDVLVSRPYIEVTLQIMRAFGADVAWLEDEARPTLRVAAGQHYKGRAYAIECDASSAAYPFCAAAITGGRVRVEGVDEHSLQADFKLLGLLERMGCTVTRTGNTVELRGPDGPLRALGDVDMNDFPDAALAYAVLALFADGPTHITNIWNLRIKETDRLEALQTELRKLGARAEASRDSLRITPGPLTGAHIDTYDDHRMAMSFALAGLRVPGVVIRDPACVSKTWPEYFEMFEAL